MFRGSGRERLDDLPELAEYLVERASRALHHETPVIAREMMDVMLRHRWPGNVRELENCLTRAVVLATGEVIRPEHLALGGTPAESPAHLATLEELEREHVERVLAATGGHKARTAEILGVGRPRLNRLIEKYELEP
ncbi:MAG: hypothetical protein GWN99_04835 [Gemmatimonadetes bacterium]|uniref:Sigma-54 factor interaction domain-containing protein n=1 Tax=Candidatus Kutchimonas denitrificans TaxID=3056748 RepID=A0AAE4ZBH4_9BACT|nr:hypothetical protein [Gemmatimonadota bacterium]NIR75876.1 hypothetical protein [Candidatus Kutchimonas denitrificans]NIS00388.1 hypothetical protein [Gemmatimonadota bacterium]NIT66052.1 hypothetical protein [Gemmatimonadota bacterium]NIU54806.1 hypothetical protein [Gemmatimonadota bacterium]